MQGRGYSRLSRHQSIAFYSPLLEGTFSLRGNSRLAKMTSVQKASKDCRIVFAIAIFVYYLVTEKADDR